MAVSNILNFAQNRVHMSEYRWKAIPDLIVPRTHVLDIPSAIHADK